MMPREALTQRNGNQKYEKRKLANRQNWKHRTNWQKMLDGKYIQMLMSKDVEEKNREAWEDKKCEAWEEKGKTNKYILHLKKLYKEFKFEECLNYGLENIEKLKKKNYVGKIEFLKIIGNVYFYLENYKYSSLTYILLSKYLNKVSDGYKVEICYNAGVVFMKYFLHSNDITYYLNAKTSFHCSMLYNEKGSKYFNETIYENTVGILRRHFPIGGKEQTKEVDDQNSLFANSSCENIFLESGTDLTAFSDGKGEAVGSEAKDSQGEDPQTKEFFSLADSKSCTLKSETHKVDEMAKGGKGKSQEGEEDVYFDSNNTETFSIYDGSVDMRDFVLRKSDALAKLEKEAALLDEEKVALSEEKRVAPSEEKKAALHDEEKAPTGRSTPNVQLKEDRQDKTVCSDHNLVNVSNEESNVTNNFCSNLKNILFRNPVNSFLKNSPSSFVKSKSSSFLKSTPGSILKSSSHNILKKFPGSIISNSPVNFVSQPTGNILRSSSTNYFNNTAGGNAFVGSPTGMVRSDEGNIVRSGEGNVMRCCEGNVMRCCEGNVMRCCEGNVMRCCEENVMRSSEGNFANNASPQFLNKHSPCNFPQNTPRFLPSHSTLNIASNSPISFANNQRSSFASKSPTNFVSKSPTNFVSKSPANFASKSLNNFANNQRSILQNNASPIFGNSFPNKRMSQQKSIIKFMRRSTDEKIDEEGPKMPSNSNECRAFDSNECKAFDSNECRAFDSNECRAFDSNECRVCDSMPTVENDLLQHKRRKTNQETPLSVSCENSVGRGSDVFLWAKDNKMCTFDYCSVQEKEDVSDSVGHGAKGDLLLEKVKSGSLREEAQGGSSRGGTAEKDAVEEGEGGEGQIKDDTVRREKPKREKIKRGKVKRGKDKKGKVGKGKEVKSKTGKGKEVKAKVRRPSALFDELFSNESLNGSLLSKVRSACKEYQSRLISEYYHIYHLKNKKQKAKQIVKRKRIADLFHDLYEICKKNKHEFSMKFVDQVTRTKGVSDGTASRQGGLKKRMLTNDKGTSSREEVECYPEESNPPECNANLKMSDKGEVSREGTKKGSLLIPIGGGYNSVKQEERGDTPHSLRNYEGDTVDIVEMNCLEKGGHKKELQMEQRKEVERQTPPPFDVPRFVNLYSEIRSSRNRIREEKHQKEKKEIEEVIILSINKINKKRIRDKVKKLSSYNNSILSNIGDKFVDDMDELFLIKNYAKILKSIKRNESIRHIYYLYENMYAIDKFDHINGSNFFNISHFIIDILLLKRVKQKDYLKKKIHKMKYSYQNYYAIYDSGEGGPLFKDLLRHIFNPPVKDTVKGDPKDLAAHIIRTEHPQLSLNFLPFLFKDKRKEADLNEQNDPYSNVKFSSTTTVNNSDTNSYTNQKKEELLGERMKEVLSGERPSGEQASAAKGSEAKEEDVKEGDVKEGDVKEGDVKEGDVKEGDVKEGDVNDDAANEEDLNEDDVNDDAANSDTGDTSDATDRNKPILRDFFSISSGSQHGESNGSSIRCVARAYKCEMEKLYVEMGKEDEEILDVEKFYEHMNVANASSDEGRAKAEEVVLMLFYHYCGGGGGGAGGPREVRGDREVSTPRVGECTIRRALFKIFFFFTSNGIINKKNLHEYVTFLRLYQFYLANFKCDPFIYFYHNIEKDSDQIVNSVKRKNVVHQDFTTSIMFDDYLNVIHCHLNMLKLLHKAYLNKLKRKHTYDNVNLEPIINHTFSILNCLLIKYSYDEEGGVVRRRVVFLFLQFLYLNSKYYFKNVTFFLDKYDINYLVKSETGNFCKVNADQGRIHSIYKNARRRGPKVKGHRKGEAHEGYKEMGEEHVVEEELLRKRPYEHEEQKGDLHSGQANAKQGLIHGEGEKQRSSEEDDILDNQGDANEEEPHHNGEERATGEEEEPLYEGIAFAEEAQDRGRKGKETFGESREIRENHGNKRDPLVDKKEWRNEVVSKKGQAKKRKSTTHNSSVSNMEKFKKVFTKLDQNVNIAFSSFLKCYHKCFFILNLRLHENDMFRRIVWKIAQRIVRFCNDLYTILKIKKIPINRSYNYVFHEINHSLYRKNIFLKPSFFKVLREDNYVMNVYSVHKSYIEKGARRRVGSHDSADADQNDVLNILIAFAKWNRGGCQRKKVNKKKKRFIFLVHSYKYIKKCICKELKENSILSLYKKAKQLDENFSQSIDYLHSLFDTRLCMLSLDFELQNIIIEFLNRCMEFIKQYDQEQDPRFVIINKMMSVYSCVFSLFYLRLNSFSEFHTNKLHKILGVEKNIFSYDDQATWHMLNVFNFVNFRYGCSYRFLNAIFTSFHVLVNVLVKIDVHVEVDRKRIGRGKWRCKGGTQRRMQISSPINTHTNATRLPNYEQVQKIIEREKRKNVRSKGVPHSVGGVRFGKGIIYKIVNEVKKKVTVSGKLKIKNSILENIIGKRMNRYFVNPLGGEVGMKKLERRMGQMCDAERMEGVGGEFSSISNTGSVSRISRISSVSGTFSRAEEGHRGGRSSNPRSGIPTESQVETIAAVDRCAASKSKSGVRAKGGKLQMSHFNCGSRRERILQSYGKLKKIKKKLKRKINNVCYFKYIAVINKSENKIYSTLSRTYAHILFILISILHIENYNILHLRKNQDFFMNNDIYNTYYLFLHISSSIILLLSSVLKTYLHFNPSVRSDKEEFAGLKLGQTEGLIGIEKRGKSVPNVRDEDGMASEEGGESPRQRQLSQDGSASKESSSASMSSHTSDDGDGELQTNREEEKRAGGYQIYLETLLKFSSINVLLMSKRKHNKGNKMKKNKYIFIFCNLIENLLQNSMFYVDLFNNCKNRDVLEMNDVLSKLTKLCKENNIMDDFMQIKKELIYHSLFKYILQEEYINHFNRGINELYKMNKCSLNLFYFSLNILLTTFNTDISIHLERSLHNIHHFSHDNLYYDLILNNIKRTVRYIRESSKSSFNCIFACVLYYLARWKKGGGKMLKGKNSDEKNSFLRRNTSNQRFASSYNMEEVKGSLFFNMFSKEECTNGTVLAGSVDESWRGKGDGRPECYVHRGEGSCGIFRRPEGTVPGSDKHVEKDVEKHVEKYAEKHVENDPDKRADKRADKCADKRATPLKAHQRGERKIISELVYDMISPYVDVKHIKVYNKIYRNSHTINSLINICFSFLFNSFLFLKPVYPFDILSKEKSENEPCAKKIKTTNYTLDIFSMKRSDIKAVELFLSLYIHKYMQSICLDVKKLVDYNTYMNQFFWVSNRRSVSVALPSSDYAYLNYAAKNVYYTFNDYNVLQFLINFKRSKSEGKEFMMSFVKVFERMISLDEEMSADHTDPLTYSVYLDYLKDLFLNDDYYYVCFYEYIKNVYVEDHEGEFQIEDLDCYLKELNEINPYKIREEMRRKFDEHVQKSYLLLTVRRRSGRGRGESGADAHKLRNKGGERIKIVLNNNPYHFQRVYRAYKNRLFSLLNKKSIDYLELVKVLNKKQYNHFSNMFYCSFIHILSEVKYDYNKQYNFNIAKIMDKLNIGLKASFYNNKNVILYYYTFQQYFHLYKFLEDKYFSEFVLPEYMLLNITCRFVNNFLYNTNLYRIYCFLKFLYIRNVLKHTEILLNFLLYVYYKYFHYHYRGKDEFSHHFMDLFLSIHEESYNNSLLVTELKGKDTCVESSLLAKNTLVGEIPLASSTKEGPPLDEINREETKGDGTNDQTATADEKYNDDNHASKGGSQTQSAYQEINNYHLVLSNSQNRFIHLLFFKILTNCVKSKINILNAKNLFNNLNFFISSYVKYSLFYTFEGNNKAFMDALKHKYSFYNFQAVKKNLKLCVYLKNVYLKRDLFNSNILSFLNIECAVKGSHYTGELTKKRKEKGYANSGAPQFLEHIHEGEHSPGSLQRHSGLECRNDETASRKRTIGDKEKDTHDVEGSSKNEMNKKKKLLSGEACPVQGDAETNWEENYRGDNVAEILTDAENQIVGAQTIRVKREVEEKYANVERANQVDAFQGEKREGEEEEEGDDQKDNQEEDEEEPRGEEPQKEEQQGEKQKSNPREGENPRGQIFRLNSLEDTKKGSQTREDLHENQIKVKKEELSDGNDSKVSIDSLTKADVLRRQFFKKRSSKKISKKYYVNILKFYLANRAQGYAVNFAECQKLEDKSIYLVFLFLGKIFQFLFNSLLSQGCCDRDEAKNDNKRERGMRADASEWPDSSYTYENLLRYFMLITMCHYADSLIFLSVHFLDLHQIGSQQSDLLQGSFQQSGTLQGTLQGSSQQSSSQKGTLQQPCPANDEKVALSPKEEANTYNLAGEEEGNQEGNKNQNETCDSHMKKLNYCEKLRVERSPGKNEDGSNSSNRNDCENHFEKKNLILKPSLTSTSSYYMCRNEAVYIMNGDKESTQMIIPLYKLLVTRLKICLYYPRYFFLASLFSYKYDTRLSDDLLTHVKDLNLSEDVKYYTYDVDKNGKGSVSTVDGDCNGDAAKVCSVVGALNGGERGDHLGEHSTGGINCEGSNGEGNEANEANASRKISDPQDEANMLEHNSKNSGRYNEHAKNGTLSFRKKKQSFHMCVNYYTDYHENGNSNNCSFPSLCNSSNSMENEDANPDMEVAEGGQNGIKHVKENSVRKVITGEVTKQEERGHVEITPPRDTYERELDEKDMNEFNYDVHKLKVVIKNIEIRYEDVLNDIVEGLNFIAENKNCGNYNSQAAYHLCIYYFMRKNYTKCIHYMKFFISKGNFKIWQNDSFNQDYYNLYCKRVQRSEFIFIKYFTIVLEVSKNVLKNVLSKINEGVMCENGNVAEGKGFTGCGFPCLDGPPHGDDTPPTDDFLCAHLGKFLVDEKVLDLFKEEKGEEVSYETPAKHADEGKGEEGKVDECKTDEGKADGLNEGNADASRAKEPKETNVEEYKGSPNKENANDSKERPILSDITSGKNDPAEVEGGAEEAQTAEAAVTAGAAEMADAADAGNDTSNQKENKLAEIENKWIYLGYDHLDHLSEIYDILKILFEIYMYIGKTIKRFNDYKVLEEATVLYGYNISVINVLFKIITEHLCFIFEVLCYFTPHMLVYPIILLFANDGMMTCTVSGGGSENVTETPPKSTTPVSSKYAYLKRAANNEELICNRSSASLDLRIFKLFREFLANKSATMPANLSTRMHSVFLLTCKKVLYYQKSEQDIIKNLSSYNRKGNKKKKEGIIKFVDNALNNGNKTNLSSFLNLFKNGKMLNCTNYLNCENIKFLTSKLNYNSSCTDMNKSTQLIHVDNNSVEKATSQVDKENTICTANDVGNDLPGEVNTSMLSNNDSVDEQRNKEWVLYHIKLNSDKHVFLYDDYDIFNNIKTKNEALNCVNSMLSDKNSAAKKGETSNLKKRKTMDSTLTDVKNSIRERDLRRLNREKSKVV
ncbi:conserved Plasmodium protein, unknown function [Plasmodium vivax]|uniref:Uncharacterized protein n=1 Tax=Plasmodium vivax TaxID=5855 RepID=A0A565A2G9_PLAVI|nr:conserved Plasmodium protein, unknown function [Plasmodium vivax]